MESENKNHLLTIISSAAVVLIALSFVPWGDLTNRQFKDFNLVSDLLPQPDKSFITDEVLDPELQNLAASLDNHELGAAVDSLSDTTAVEIFTDNFKAPERDGSVLLEDYSNGAELAKIKSALNSSASRLVRIAVVGDSYIEGDIFTQNVRSMLQDIYGGSGVGYMPAYNPFPGFRPSVFQAASGWADHDIRKMDANDLRVIQGQYFTAEEGAKTSFRGAKNPAHVDSWSRSSFMFVAPENGSILLAISDGSSRSYDIQASDDVQFIELPGSTTSLKMSTDIIGLKALGFWLTDNTGVSLDCMSLRGNSGISHRNLNQQIAAQMRANVNYDIIVLEFGINALSSAQKEYSAYAHAMSQVVRSLRMCYPNAAILLMGIGDRGQKQGTAVGSIGTAQAMVSAQRGVARVTKALFWDTRQAMGGEGSVVDWHQRGLVNSDYIHLNHKGGRALAEIFVKSLKLSISE